MNHTTQNLQIYSLQQAEDFLNLYGINYSVDVENSLDDLLLYREEWVDFINIEKNIKDRLQKLYFNCLSHFECPNMQMLGRISLDCIFLNRLHDFLMPLLYQGFEEADNIFFNKTSGLSNANVTAEQLGAPENFAVPLLAAVVELTNLDNHKSSLEKLHCLTTTYDLIFAELKTAMINVISKSSGETEIPVINNSDILPILMTVIIKSKLVHLHSNLYFMQVFMGCLNQKENIKHIFGNFKDAIAQIEEITRHSLKPASSKVIKDLNLMKFIEVSSEVCTKLQHDSKTPLEGHVVRVTNLIVTSTNENHPVV